MIMLNAEREVMKLYENSYPQFGAVNIFFVSKCMQMPPTLSRLDLEEAMYEEVNMINFMHELSCTYSF